MLSKKELVDLETLIAQMHKAEYWREMSARRSSTFYRVFAPPPEDWGKGGHHLYSVTRRFLSRRNHNQLVALMGDMAA